MTIGEVQLVQNKNKTMKQFLINMFKFSVSEPSSNTSSRRESEITLPNKEVTQIVKYTKTSFLPKDLVPPTKNIKYKNNFLT